MRRMVLACCLLVIGASNAWGTARAAEPRSPADPNKVLRVSFPQATTGFDPARISDLYSNTVVSAIFHTLVKWDWLASPSRLVPYAAEAMPEVSPDGLTYTFKIRKGLYFTPDPAFKGKRRELQAKDFAYTIFRHADPKSISPQLSDFEDVIVGLADAHKKAIEAGKFDYDQKIPGIEVLDSHTLRLRLTRPSPELLDVFERGYMGAMAREVVEFHGAEAMMQRPVGSGPYRLERVVPGSKIILTANPDFPGFEWNYQAEANAIEADRKVAEQMKGRLMPQVGRVEISIIEEAQSAWLAFQGGELDLLNVPTSFIEKALTPKNELQPELAQKGMGMYRSVESDIRYQFFNLKDPAIGGYTPERIALRRAIIMAFDVDEEIRVIRKNQAIKATQLVAPVIPGHDPNYRGVNRYDPALANALLDHYGYRKGPDGFRVYPDGKPLVFTIFSSTASIDRERDELWKRSMDRVGIRLEVKKDKFPEMLKQGKQCAVPSWGLGWTRASNVVYVMKLLSSRTIGMNNYACFENADYDRYFEQLKVTPPGPERTRILHNLYRLMEVYGVMSLSSTALTTRLNQPWVVGSRKHPIVTADFMYFDIQKQK
ncbi:MAG: Periplasmic dipeptide transport protein precursor [Pseudomonadota bacterium]